ncbi:MAG: hypothetical protein L6R41_006626 [Letrouitia leprolyta]|nr:MAG: hypothetical protein L6R41_006626 [Letrouitia leprolyta]
MGIGSFLNGLRKPKTDMAIQNSSDQDPAGQSPSENSQQLNSISGQQVASESQHSSKINGAAHSGRDDHPGPEKVSHTSPLESRERSQLPHQNGIVAHESNQIISADLDVSGDLGLQSRPLFSDESYPTIEAYDTVPSKGTSKASEASSDESRYSPSTGDGRDILQVPTEKLHQNDGYVENALSRTSIQISDILSSATPRRQETSDHQRISQPNTAISEVSEEIPRQDSDITLCGSIAFNGVYKIQESQFGKDCTFIKKIGEGGFGKIELYRHTPTNKLLVLKKTRDSFEYTNGIPKEAHILRDIIKNSHKRLPCMYHFNASLAECHYWMDHCDGGDLLEMAQYFLYRVAVILEGFIWHVHTQLSAATAYLHTGLLDHTNPELLPPLDWQPIVHRDIKPDNVFLKLVPGKIYPDIVLGDFGLATTSLVSGRPDHFIGTAIWQSPQFPIHTIDSDVWSAGAVIHHLALMYPPLATKPKNDPRTAFEWEHDGSTRKVWDIGWRGYSTMLQETLKEWLSFEEGTRPVGLSGVLKAEGGRMIWLAEGGIEKDLGGWQDHIKSGKPDKMNWNPNPKTKKRGSAWGFGAES